MSPHRPKPARHPSATRFLPLAAALLLLPACTPIAEQKQLEYAHYFYHIDTDFLGGTHRSESGPPLPSDQVPVALQTDNGTYWPYLRNGYSLHPTTENAPTVEQLRALYLEKTSEQSYSELVVQYRYKPDKSGCGKALVQTREFLELCRQYGQMRSDHALEVSFDWQSGKILQTRLIP